MTTELDTLLAFGVATVATPEETLAGSVCTEMYTPANAYASIEKRIRASEREDLCMWLEKEFASCERASTIITAIRERKDTK